MTRVSVALAEAESLEELVHLAVGAASMCWESMRDTGPFDEAMATAISQSVVKWVQAHYRVMAEADRPAGVPADAVVAYAVVPLDNRTVVTGKVMDSLCRDVATRLDQLAPGRLTEPMRVPTTAADVAILAEAIGAEPDTLWLFKWVAWFPAGSDVPGAPVDA